MCVYALQCNGNLLQKALRKQLVGAQIDPKCALVADVKTKFFALDGVDRGVSEGSSGRFEGHFLACRCSLQHHRITHFLLISPNFRGGGRKGEDISCLVVKSGKCYQRKGNGEVVSLGFLL